MNPLLIAVIVAVIIIIIAVYKWRSDPTTPKPMPELVPPDAGQYAPMPFMEGLTRQANGEFCAKIPGMCFTDAVLTDMADFYNRVGGEEALNLVTDDMIAAELTLGDDGMYYDPNGTEFSPRFVKFITLYMNVKMGLMSAPESYYASIPSRIRYATPTDFFDMNGAPVGVADFLAKMFAMYAPKNNVTNIGGTYPGIDGAMHTYTGAIDTSVIPSVDNLDVKSKPLGVNVFDGGFFLHAKDGMIVDLDAPNYITIEPIVTVIEVNDDPIDTEPPIITGMLGTSAPTTSMINSEPESTPVIVGTTGRAPLVPPVSVQPSAPVVSISSPPPSPNRVAVDQQGRYRDMAGNLVSIDEYHNKAKAMHGPPMSSNVVTVKQTMPWINGLRYQYYTQYDESVIPAKEVIQYTGADLPGLNLFRGGFAIVAVPGTVIDLDHPSFDARAEGFHARRVTMCPHCVGPCDCPGAF